MSVMDILKCLYINRIFVRIYIVKVAILSYTPDAEKLVASSARVCYSEEGAIDIFSSINGEKIKKRITDAVSKGHLSILEHACYTFSIEGISRVTSHQLVRHRIASFSQQSQRYVRFKDKESYVIPRRIAENETLVQRYEKTMGEIFELYESMISSGIPAEDARYILPSSVVTNIVVTMNARELLHFFSLRCCKKAQWEIRSLAWKMLRELLKVSPIIFDKAGPDCMKGICPQDDFKCLEKMKRFYRSDK